jgi:hypothetical protein
MKLRDHPAFNYHGLPSWPPIWSNLTRRPNNRPKGEAGILKRAQPPIGSNLDRCFLHIEYEGERYIGCLFISDRAFAQQVISILQEQTGKEIAEIGELDVSHLL